MERRTFLKGLMGAAGIFAMDPERALWVPGEKTIFVPPATVVNPEFAGSAPFLRFYDPTGQFLRRELRIDVDTNEKIMFEMINSRLRRVPSLGVFCETLEA